ncbi:MAG: hypothetical protein GF399_03460 [Candidatus Coatesbacteria bacterium]|nr:hypothetical protein [Candidatus Coatesbacteria bacterium]
MSQEPHQPFIPAGAELTPEVLREQERRFLELLEELIAAGERHGAVMRVIGSLAFRIKCPDYKHIMYANRRYLTDVDFIAYKKQAAAVQDAFWELGWEENQTVLRLFGDKRRIFYHPTQPVHSDIFLDKLAFCHPIDFRGRLELDAPTITLADLLLEKLQIVEINKKDLVDVLVLLSAHEVTDEAGSVEAVDGARLAKLCSKSWGWWRTATMNLDKLLHFSEEYLEPEQRPVVQERLRRLKEFIDERSKSLGWHVRSWFGERFPWYDEVEEVER